MATKLPASMFAQLPPGVTPGSGGEFIEKGGPLDRALQKAASPFWNAVPWLAAGVGGVAVIWFLRKKRII